MYQKINFTCQRQICYARIRGVIYSTVYVCACALRWVELGVLHS